MNQFSILKADPALADFRWSFEDMQNRIKSTEHALTGGRMSLYDFADSHNYYGLHFDNGEWVFREWAPNATYVFLIGEFSNWQKQTEYALKPIDNGNWEIRKPPEFFAHQQLFKLALEWPGGSGERIPSHARRVVQDEHTKIFNAQVWHPETPYQWKHPHLSSRNNSLLIYEAHIGMAQEHERVSTYAEFREYTLPRIIDAGYNTIQIMAIAEHPYYGSFGYQVSNFFAPSSRFGTPEELKELIDAAHEAGVAVFLDLVHSHSVKNELEGLGRFDGTMYQYFHDRGDNSDHPIWDSRLFNYDSHVVLRFLLSNVRYWFEEFNFDGFRFDGVTSMIYRDHGIGRHFGHYPDYFAHNLERSALTYLGLACKVAHQAGDKTMIAEDVSGLPGLATSFENGGIGFDYRLSLGIPDFWAKMLKKVKDENWNVEEIFHELTNRRAEEKVISYVECHDQALVGDQTFIFRLIGNDMYHHMHTGQRHLMVDRGIAIHKLIRLMTLATSGHGYLNFMGNEFGHPEWIDFPRDGNNWSYYRARRCWSLRDNPDLYYYKLGEWDKSIIWLAKEFGIHTQEWPYRYFTHCDDQILAFGRGSLVFIVNFNSRQSFTDYAITLPEGTYSLLLDSDKWEFGGQSRVEQNQTFQTSNEHNSSNIRMYLPTRTALVLKRSNHEE